MSSQNFKLYVLYCGCLYDIEKDDIYPSPDCPARHNLTRNFPKEREYDDLFLEGLR